MKFSAAGESFKMKYVKQCMTDWKTYIASKQLVYITLQCIFRLTALSSGHIYGLVRFLVITPSLPLTDHLHSDGPLFAFSLFTPTIINKV